MIEEAGEMIERSSVAGGRIREETERERERNGHAHVERLRTLRDSGGKGNRGYPSDGSVISYRSAVTRGAFPSVDLFALPILTSPKRTPLPPAGNTK